MFDFLKVVMPLLPLRIKNIKWDGEALIISGDDWSFNTISVWRVSKGKTLLFACWDNQASVRIEDLIELSVEKVTWVSENQPIDPSLALSDGTKLDVFCSSVFEPWVFNLPDDVVYVGNT